MPYRGGSPVGGEEASRAGVKNQRIRDLRYTPKECWTLAGDNIPVL
jgi:hypothetical protein